MSADHRSPRQINEDLFDKRNTCDTTCALIAAFRENVVIKPKSSHGLRHRRDIRMQQTMPVQEEGRFVQPKRSSPMNIPSSGHGEPLTP